MRRSAFKYWSKAPSLDEAALVGTAALGVFCFTEAYFRTDLADADCSLACRYPPLHGFFDGVHIQNLERHGYVEIKIGHTLLSNQALEQARGDIVALQRESRFSASTNSVDVRQDRVCWVREDDGTSKAPHQAERHLATLGDGILHCVRLLRGLTFALESCGNYTTSHTHRIPKQLQLGFYPGDMKAVYERHLDTCTDSWFEMGLLEFLRSSDYRARVLTFILYLNDPNWREGAATAGGDGGQLRIFHSDSGLLLDGTSMQQVDSYADITPRGGTLVIFDSRRMEHQVMPSQRDRFALTCWVTGEVGK